jgi:hypothetical protein
MEPIDSTERAKVTSKYQNGFDSDGLLNSAFGLGYSDTVNVNARFFAGQSNKTREEADLQMRHNLSYSRTEKSFDFKFKRIPGKGE